MSSPVDNLVIDPTTTNGGMNSSSGGFFRSIGNGISSFLKGIGNFWKKLTGSGTTTSEQNAMDYNAEQAQINRDFQSSEAQIARQWQEDFYTKYQSPAAQVRQYQEAGLNPALMYGRGVTPVSASSASNGPSGDSASVGLPNVDSASLMSLIFQAAKLPSEVDLLQSQADENKAKARGQEIQNCYSEPLLQQELSKGQMSIANSQAALVTAQMNWQLMDSETKLNYVKSELTDAQIKDVLASADLKSKQAATEVLRRANLEVTNELIAAQIVTEQMRPALIAAQTYVANQQGNSFSLDNFQKDLQNSLSYEAGLPSSISWPQLVFNAASGIAIRTLHGAKSLFMNIKDRVLKK